MMMTIEPPGLIKVSPGRSFLRFDQLFCDAVRSGKRSAIVEVLLRLQLSADNARRTAQKILADRRCRFAGRELYGGRREIAVATESA